MQPRRRPGVLPDRQLGVDEWRVDQVSHTAPPRAVEVRNLDAIDADDTTLGPDHPQSGAHQG